jgi:hypothetical protein
MLPKWILTLRFTIFVESDSNPVAIASRKSTIICQIRRFCPIDRRDSRDRAQFAPSAR